MCLLFCRRPCVSCVVVSAALVILVGLWAVVMVHRHPTVAHAAARAYEIVTGTK